MPKRKVFQASFLRWEHVTFREGTVLGFQKGAKCFLKRVDSQSVGGSIGRCSCRVDGVVIDNFSQGLIKPERKNWLLGESFE